MGNLGNLNRTFSDKLGIYKWDLVKLIGIDGNPVFKKLYVTLF